MRPKANESVPKRRRIRSMAAISRAVGEIGRISDPHRAIDWLSTFPQIVLITLGERS